MRLAVLITSALMTLPVLAQDTKLPVPPADSTLFGEDAREPITTVTKVTTFQVPPEVDRTSRESICLMVEAAARANNLPAEFFARIIWQESRFQSDAVGPMTRRGTRAQGIAQFMPGTAAERAAARSVRSGSGAAQIRRVSGRAAQQVRQSRLGGGGLQCRAAAGTRLARRITYPAERDPQLRLSGHWYFRRRLGGRRQGLESAAAAELQRYDRIAQARA